MNQPIVQLLAKHFLVVTVLLIGAFIARRRSAAFRHGYWVIGFAWVLLLPILIAKVPHWTVERDVPHAITTQNPLSLARNTRRHSDAPPTNARLDPLAVIEEPKSLAVQAVVATSPGHRDAGPILLGIYGVGVLICFAGLCQSLLSISRIRRRSVSATPEDVIELASAAKAVGLRRVPDLLVNPEVAVPMTFWMGRSVVVTPCDKVSRAVLLHECAHIRRGDWFAQVFARLIRALFWFDPVLLFAEREMRAASEQAADDIVVSAGIEPVQYAEELFTLAARSRTKEFNAGLAIVGGSDLKSRVGQILRIGPRVVRLPFRWVAITMLLGAFTVIPFAAFHYIRSEVPSAENGFVDFGNGFWFRVLAVTRFEAKKAISWNMQGQLLPRAVVQYQMEGLLPLSTRRTGKHPNLVLTLETNIQDYVGVRVLSPMPTTPDGSPDLTNMVLGDRLNSIATRNLCSLAFRPRSGDSEDLKIELPGTNDWSTAATADYRDNKLTKATDASLFPASFVPDSATPSVVKVPKGLTGQIELQIFTENSSDPFTEEIDSGGGTEFNYQLSRNQGQLTKIVIRTRPLPTTYLLSNIPTHPVSSKIEDAIPPPGLTYRDASNSRFTLPDGEVLSLIAVSESLENKPLSWSPEGRVLSAPVPGNSLTDLLRTDHRDYEITTLLKSGDALRVMSFSVSGKPAKMRYQLVGLFDAAGIRTGYMSSARSDQTESETSLVTTVSDPTKTHDFVVQIKDATRSSQIRMPFADVYTERHAKPAPNHIYLGKSLIDLMVTRKPRIADLKSDANHDLTFNLLDANGKTIQPCMFETHETVDEYFINKRDLPRVKSLQVVSMPYIYVRFPKVAMNPTQ